MCQRDLSRSSRTLRLPIRNSGESSASAGDVVPNKVSSSSGFMAVRMYPLLSAGGTPSGRETIARAGETKSGGYGTAEEDDVERRIELCRVRFACAGERDRGVRGRDP